MFNVSGWSDTLRICATDFNQILNFSISDAASVYDIKVQKWLVVVWQHGNTVNNKALEHFQWIQSTKTFYPYKSVSRIRWDMYYDSIFISFISFKESNKFVARNDWQNCWMLIVQSQQANQVDSIFQRGSSIYKMFIVAIKNHQNKVQWFILIFMFLPKSKIWIYFHFTFSWLINR